MVSARRVLMGVPLIGDAIAVAGVDTVTRTATASERRRRGSRTGWC
jgi:hypothetical protein